MDDQDARLRARLERLSEAVPVDSAGVATQPVRRSSSSRPNRLLTGALVALAASAVAIAGLGLAVRLPAPGPVGSAGQAGLNGTAAVATAGAMPSAVATGAAASSRMPPPAGASTERAADGIPTAFDGQPVLRGMGALNRANATPDTTPFLVGGWLTVQHGAFYCAIEVPALPPWASSCGAPALSDTAGATDARFARRITFRLLRNGLANPIDGVFTGPVVLRVHVRDPRASECGHAADLCAAMMVVDEVLWTGDAATAPRPISATAALAAVESVVNGGRFALDGAGVVHTSCAAPLPAGQFYEGAPSPGDRPTVASIEVLPTTVARERAAAQAEGTSGTMTKAALVCQETMGSGSQRVTSQSRWLVVANVAVLVQLHTPMSSADPAFVDRLSRALASAVAAASSANP